TETACNASEESPEHIEIKHLVYLACRAQGWETTVESAGPGRTWVADVLAEKDARKVAFEIQLSSISSKELVERDRKYREAGIESYWLLENFLNRTREFESWYTTSMNDADEQYKTRIPYLDPDLFLTGPENHIFVTTGIRTIGLCAKKQALFTTNNPNIPLAATVREVLKGNYHTYLLENKAMMDQRKRLKQLAAPALIRLHSFYPAIIRDKTYRKKLQSFAAGLNRKNGKRDPAKERDLDRLTAEISWLENEYRSCISDGSGLFVWKKPPGRNTAHPYFRLESETTVKKLQEYTDTFSRWETAFNAAVGQH
ncbi:MAG: hypothetical protein GYA23_02260, partial [Methanomicrobiales archaeon]|nr:hypothetical protein [Methanomicrobiales archaeon]